MRVIVLMSMRVFVGMIVAVGMFVLVILHRMSLIVLMAVFCEDIDLGSGKATAKDLPVLKASSNVESSNRLLKQRDRNTSIDEGAEKHVAADAGEAFEISNTHQERL